MSLIIEQTESCTCKNCYAEYERWELFKGVCGNCVDEIVEAEKQKKIEMQELFDEIRDEVDLDVCRQCEHWTEYNIMPGDDPRFVGECNNFNKPDECQGVSDEMTRRSVCQSSGEFNQLCFIG